MLTNNISLVLNNRAQYFLLENVLPEAMFLFAFVFQCEKCGKPFSMAQLDDYKDLTACVFCRVHSAEKTMSSITGFLSDKSDLTTSESWSH